MLIGVVNHSKRMNNVDVQTMTRACAQQLRLNTAPHWEKQPPAVMYFSDDSHMPPGGVLIGVFDDSDQADALGWHTEANGRVFGRVFAAPVLDNHGTVFVGSLSVSSILSHEVQEAFIDPAVQMWADDFNGRLYAVEISDPVESDVYNIVVQVNGRLQPVAVSNFVFPAWFDPQTPTGTHVDYMGVIHQPFALGRGGYCVYEDSSGKIQQEFGDVKPDAWRLKTKDSPLARTARRKLMATRT